jgi:cephalosporin-C deacetylase
VTIFDLPLAELEQYVPDLEEPDDFDTFWGTTIAQARTHDLDVAAKSARTGLKLVDVEDLTFSGFDGQRISAWVIRPAGPVVSSRQALPAVVEFMGYGGGRGLPFERLTWAAAGYVHVVMDTRGQGSAWGAGVTADPVGSGPAVPGFMTQGILDPASYYYRRLITDAVRAVDAVRSLPYVDPERVTVAGKSQGGGIAIAAAGLCDGLAAALVDVPFLCHFRRAVDITDRAPYYEIVSYLQAHRDAADAVFRTLSYHDAVLFARRASAPSLFSVALRDMTCPPSTVFAARNSWGAATTAEPSADIEVYPFNLHEGGMAHHVQRQLEWLERRLNG